MEAHHASRGRKKLEEIRQKRAAGKMVSTGSDLDSNGSTKIQEDSSALLYRIKELENKNTQLEDENKKLLSKLEEGDIEKNSLIKQLNSMEHDILPSMKKSLKDMSIEKDAAIVAREDLLVQLRTIKKRFKEAEEEQYRAEEDAASLRAELNSLQQQEMSNKFNDIISTGIPADHVQALEREIMDLKSQLQDELMLRKQENQKLIEEQSNVFSLLAEKKELERRVTNLMKQNLDEASEDAVRKVISKKDREKADKQLHDMALMVEKLENSRQKLLTEIDSQSSEIERLFEENSNLAASYEGAITTAAEWKKQVTECLNQNKELRAQLDKMRFDMAEASYRKDIQHNTQNDNDSTMSLEENPSLKLAKEQSKSEALSAEVMRLSAELKHAVKTYNNLTQILYKPILRNIESNLMKMKQESFVRI
ncbi:Myosin heavy chain-related protein [Zostera marina]|uniref:Myosin heavy chain-related protein n=1 Tax=Zostera marina TaxID=29655 RepID=A0A0K9P1Z6_ZOSMR|nr:Myosin heavy chain-related protein [Zostera marina]